MSETSCCVKQPALQHICVVEEKQQHFQMHLKILLITEVDISKYISNVHIWMLMVEA